MKRQKASSSLRLVSISRLKPISLNTPMMFFLTFSVCCPLRFLSKASPLSHYNPNFDFGSIYSSFDWIQSPTSLHISDPSKLPIVTSKQLSLEFLFEVLLSENTNDLRQWFMKHRFCLVMFVCCFANLSVRCRMFSIGDG